MWQGQAKFGMEPDFKRPRGPGSICKYVYGVGKIFKKNFLKKKKDSYAHQAFIYLIKNIINYYINISWNILKILK